MEQVTETSMEQYQVFINHWDQTPEMLLPASSIWSNTRFSSTTKGQTPRILLPASSTIASHCIVCALRVSMEVVEGWKEALREAGGTDISALQFKTKERKGQNPTKMAEYFQNLQNLQSALGFPNSDHSWEQSSTRSALGIRVSHQFWEQSSTQSAIGTRVSHHIRKQSST